MTKLTESEYRRLLRSNVEFIESVSSNAATGVVDGLGANGTPVQPRNKYGNRKCTFDGHVFDSQAELRRYLELRTLQDAGEITHLRLQPRYRLQDAFIDGSGRRHRAIDYIADFEYAEDGQTIAEDVKGGKPTQTSLWAIKWKLAIQRYPHIEFRKVE